jgi:hypothetical protein
VPSSALVSIAPQGPTTGYGQARPKLNPEKETKGKQCRHSAHLNSVTVRAYVHDLLFVAVHRLRPPLPRRC